MRKFEDVRNLRWAKIGVFLGLGPSLAHASPDILQLWVGVELSPKGLWIEDREKGPKEIARLEQPIRVWPSLSLNSRSFYTSSTSQWGTHFELSGSPFVIDKQKKSNGKEPEDVGTGVKGYSIYAVPLLYYHFRKHAVDEWNYKVGIGVGAGYMNLWGNFRITDPSHERHEDVIPVDLHGVGIAVGVYFNASYKNHNFTIQNYGPVVWDDDYEYQLHNAVLSYQYAFRLF